MSNLHFFDDLQNQCVLPTFVRGVSDENMFGLFFCPPSETNNTNSEIKQKESQMMEECKTVPNFEDYVIQKEIKRKTEPKQKKDYKKNICGYITKKIVREFLASAYKEKVVRLCEKHGCDYFECLAYYDKKIERITGPTHLDMLLNSSKEEPEMKRCFKQFFIWFLRHRYLRYLIMEGKMERKDIYIDYKNKTLLYLGSNDSEGEGLLELQSKSSSSALSS